MTAASNTARVSHTPDERDTLTQMVSNRVLEAKAEMHTPTRLLGTVHALAHLIVDQHEVGDVESAFRAAMQILRLKVALMQNERARPTQDVAVG